MRSYVNVVMILLIILAFILGALLGGMLIGNELKKCEQNCILNPAQTVSAPRKRCIEYTLIEHGVAVTECGDTVILPKKRKLVLR